MLSKTFLLFVATVLSAEDGVVQIDLGREAGLRLGDVGSVYYELTVESETRRVEVGTGTVIETDDHASVLQVAADAAVRPEYLVEFRIPVLEEAGRELLRFRSDAASDSATSGSADGEPSKSVMTAEVRSLVLDWAEAWSEQEVDHYLSFYARNFRPPGGMSRGAWEARRRERISKAGSIAVSLDQLRIVTVASKAASATFVQTYRSDTYKDQVSKLLDLIREDGKWKILEEKLAE